MLPRGRSAVSQELLDVVLVKLAGFHVAIEPTIDGLEGDTEFLGQLRLAELVLEAIDDELINQIPQHDGYRV